jgi:hypothetical protein
MKSAGMLAHCTFPIKENVTAEGQLENAYSSLVIKVSMYVRES